jgi:hypothetical protein
MSYQLFPSGLWGPRGGGLGEPVLDCDFSQPESMDQLGPTTFGFDWSIANGYLERTSGTPAEICAPEVNLKNSITVVHARIPASTNQEQLMVGGRNQIGSGENNHWVRARLWNATSPQMDIQQVVANSGAVIGNGTGNLSPGYGADMLRVVLLMLEDFALAMASSSTADGGGRGARITAAQLLGASGVPSLRVGNNPTSGASGGTRIYSWRVWSLDT